ncbi:Transcriptional activator [Knufia fluminis]|uniref:Transcriptional activator n=1 Tax=Knufia fluminis TaxID=191047 RepID=A0AAN8ETU0_9EURO|nr:Transcriptional activator [Knufia fluminis]
MTCKTVGAECVYPDQPKRIFVSEKEWKDLRARAEAADSTPTPSGSMLHPLPTDDADGNEDAWWWQNREILILSRSGEHQYVGSSASTYMATQINPASRGNVAFDVSPLHHANLALRREHNPLLPPLPPFDTAKRWYAAQFVNVGSIISFIQPKYFDERLAEVYSRSPDTSSREDCLLYCQVLLILAFGQMYSINEWAGDEGPPGFKYFQAALKLLPDIHEDGSVLILCVKSGNPISIHDEDIDLAWPSPLPELDLDSAQPKVLSHYSQLSKVLGKIGQDIYRKRHKSGTTLLTSVQSIMHDLEMWLKDLPPELKLDFTSLHHKIPRTAVSIFLHYYQCINMTGRPLLLRVCQKRLEDLAAGTASATWQEGLSSNIVHIVSNSIAAARTATTVMDAAAKQNQLATYGFMDGEHAFSAALVLVMANVAFPHNERDNTSMVQALSVLKGMAEKGNEYIRARHALLLSLRSALSCQANGRSTPVTSQGRPRKGYASSGMGFEDSVSFALESETPRPTFQQFQDLSFNFTVEDNDAFWDEFSGDAQIGMDSEWIESAFQHEDVA